MMGPSVLELFAAQAARTPDAPAVRHDDADVSYAELAAQVSELAADLRGLGIGPGVAVGLYAERSAELIVALIAIMQAGGVCVPLDPSYPLDRLRYMCEDASIELVVGHRDLMPDLGPVAIQLDRSRLVAARRGGVADGSGAPTALSPELAYVVYTSGSTGRPKGVLYEHTNLANLISWQISDSDCGPGDRTLQYSPSSFDIIFQETFSTLGSGGILVVCSDEDRLDPELLIEVIARQRINRIFMPFVGIQTLANHADQLDRDTHPVAEIITAGEQVQCSDRVRTMFDRLAGCRLVNQWGTTETHVTTSLTLHPPAADWPVLPSIGTAIANSHMHLRDTAGVEVGPGETGEIWVAGTTVGPGYLGLPERTAQSFVPDSCDAGVRVYRTGDLGRFDEAGELHFLGRTDTQVKVRGFRIELGEIETVLLSIPAVAEAVVVAVGSEADERYLRAHLVLSSESWTRAKIVGRLAEQLPDYLIPSKFVFEQALPRTPSGKVDRLALTAAG